MLLSQRDIARRGPGGRRGSATRARRRARRTAAAAPRRSTPTRRPGGVGKGGMEDDVVLNAEPPVRAGVGAEVDGLDHAEPWIESIGKELNGLNQ